MLPEENVQDPVGEGNQSQTDTEQPSGPQYVTQEQLEAMRSQLTANFQRVLGNAENRITRQFTAHQRENARALEVAKKAGGMTPEQLAAYEKALQEDAMQRAVAGRSSTQEQEDGDLEVFEMETFQQQVTARGEEIAASFGLTLEDLDNTPELKLLIRDGSPQEYLRSVEYAFHRLIERTQTPPDNNRRGQTPQSGSNGNAIPPLSGSVAPPKNPIEDIESADELYQRAWNKLRDKYR
jgi:hypothetical protein